MKVNVYLSYYNGSKYIDDQLASLLNQKGVDVHIFIRNDGSKEIESNFLDKYQNVPQITIIHGENIGCSISFMWLVCKVDEKADFYAFCDQDDVWLDFKLYTACNILKKYTKPAAYGALPQYTDSKLNPLEGCSSMIDRIHFGEMSVDDALGYMIFGLGCTLVWNNALNNILKKINLFSYSVPHDNFLSVLAPFVGTFYRDDKHVILYRQHGQNASGDKRKNGKFFKKLKGFFEGIKCQKSFWIRKYILDEFGQYIQNSNKELLELSINYRSNFFNKIKLIKREMKRTDRNRKIKNLIRILGNWY